MHRAGRSRWGRVPLAVSVWLLVISPVAGLFLRGEEGGVVPSGVLPEIPVVQLGGTPSVGQSFRAERDRLAGVGVQLQMSLPGRGEWEAVLADPDGNPRCSGRFSFRSQTGRHNLWFRFPEVEGSGGKSFLFWIRKVKEGGVLLVYGSVGDRYADGSMIIDGRVGRGDLAFRTLYAGGGPPTLQTPSPTPDLEPPWFASASAAPLAVGLLAIALLFVIEILLGRILAGAPVWTYVPLLIGAVVVTGLLASHRPGRRVDLSPGGPELPGYRAGGASDLLEEYFSPETEILPAGGLVTILRNLGAGEPDGVLFMHPDMRGVGPPAVVFHLDLPERPVLRFTPWINPQAAEKGSDGVDFQVSVREPPAMEKLVYRSYFGARALRSASPVEIDLAPWQGRRIGLVLRTFPGPNLNSFYDGVGWGEPSVAGRP